MQQEMKHRLKCIKFDNYKKLLVTRDMSKKLICVNQERKTIVHITQKTMERFISYCVKYL